ncbi:hypothetical protein AB0K68_23915 [Streptomyces sp. NPDC050698]
MTDHTNRDTDAPRARRGPRSLLYRAALRVALSLAGSSGPIAYALVQWWIRTH